MHIRRYTPADEEMLFSMLTEEGDAWSDYHGTAGRAKYRLAAEACTLPICFTAHFVLRSKRLKACLLQGERGI